MARGVKACDECSKKCVLLHQKQKNQPPIVTRFFRIMFGKDFSEVMVLPPKFSRTVKDLEGQETRLEDGNGKKWPVKLTSIDGLLAFSEGWAKFFDDHHLQVGDLLVFNYIKDSHFVVFTFDTSTVETFDFSNSRRARRNKKFRRNPEMVVEEEPVHSTDVNLKDKPNSTAAIDSVFGYEGSRPTATNATNSDYDLAIPRNMEEDPAFMLNSNIVCYQEEDRDFLFDLSNFEMENKRSDADNEKALKPVPAILANAMDQMEAKDDEGLLDVVPLHEVNKTSDFENKRDLKTTLAVLNITDQVEETDADTLMDVVPTHEVDGHFCGICIDEFLDNRDDENNLSKFMGHEVRELQNAEKSSTVPIVPESPFVGSMQIDEREPAVIPKFSDSSASNSVQKDQFGFQNHIEEPVFIKKELVEFEQQTCGLQASYDAGKLPAAEMNGSQTCSPIVKVEPNLPHDLFFSVEVESLSYLEIPVSISFLRKQLSTRAKVVYLRDPSRRVWPVFYPDLLVRALCSGWSKFCKANDIKCGDVCEFRLESADACIYTVDIIHSK